MDLNAMSDETIVEVNEFGELNALKRMAEDFSRREQQPVAVYHWKDSAPTGAEGWVVQATMANGLAGGGIFMHPEASCDETVAIAFNMARKFTVCDPQIGGAKAGIRFNHLDPRAKGVLRRFICAHASLLKNTWVTAGDLNTDDSFIEKVIQEDLGLATCQATLGRVISEKMAQPDLSSQLAELLVRSATDYFPMIEAAVGYGVAQCVRLVAPDRRVIIQGFGAVGSSLAYYLSELGVKIVALADKDGFIHHPHGLPIHKLLELRKKKLESLEGSEKAECAKNFFKWLHEDEEFELYNPVQRDPASSPQEFLMQLLQSEEAEVFAPCAQRYQITESVVECLQKHTWRNVAEGNRFIVSGANNPYGVLRGTNLCEDKAGDVVSALHALGVCIVPDWVANSGTAQLFHRGLSINFKGKSARVVLDACAKPILDFLQTAITLCRGKLNYLTYACLKLAVKRLQNPMQIESASASNPAASVYALPPLPPQQQLSLEERLTSCMSVIQECTTEEELLQLLKSCPNPVAYDGFEPSGRMHIAQGLLKAHIVNKFTRSGFTFLFWVADFFAQLNHKMDGDLKKIQTLGRYFIEVWKSCGMDMDRVKFLWASEEIHARHFDYWQLLIDISSNNSLTRVQRCTQIMGRSDKESLTASQIFYPCMQATDIFFLGVDVCQLGLDQRKVNMLAREYAAKRKLNSPIIMSHPMLPGLKKGQEKMSKSDPNSAIFMEDSAEDVASKIRSAFCPEGEVEGNPCMAYMKHIVFPIKTSVPLDNDSGSKCYSNYQSFSEDYASGAISPQKLKTCLSNCINELLEPVRSHFAQDRIASDLLATVKSYRK